MDVGLHVPADDLKVALHEIGADGSWRDPPLAGPVDLDPQAARRLTGDRALLLDQRAPDPALIQLGREMLGFLAAGEVGAEWMKQRAAGARTYLAIEREDLRGLPWELIQSDAETLFTRGGPACVRCPGRTLAQRTQRDFWPLYMLILLGADPDDADIGADSEVEGILEVLRPVDHLIHCEVYDAARAADFDLDRLTKAVLEPARPHILHFIGHAAGAAGGKPARLKIFNKAKAGGTYLDWSSLQIANSLDRLPPLCMTYLNACRTNLKGDPLAAVAFSSLADTFLRRSAAVIAMQADISGQAAALCAAEFYRNLAEGLSIDAAVAEARLSLLNRYGADHREPYLPSLTVNVKIDGAVRVKSRLPKREQLNWDECLGNVRKHFVDQETAQRHLYDSLLGPDADELRSAVCILGEDDSGKTWLLKRCLHAFAMQGFLVQYVEVGGATDWLEAARLIAKPGGSPLAPGLPAAQLDSFLGRLNRLAGKPAEDAGGGPAADRAGSLVEILQRKPANDFQIQVLKALRTGLEEAAGDKLLLLALDAWKNFSPDSFQTLKEHFLEPIARDPDSRVKILAVFRRSPTGFGDEWSAYQHLGFSAGYWRKENLEGFPPEKVADLALELLRRLSGKDSEAAKAWSFLNKFPSPVKPGKLYQLCETLKETLD